MNTHGSQHAIDAKVSQLIKACFEYSERYDGIGLYAMIMKTIESAFFKVAMETCHYNCLKAAKLLGLSRINLREQLRESFGDTYSHYRSEKDCGNDMFDETQKHLSSRALGKKELIFY